MPELDYGCSKLFNIADERVQGWNVNNRTEAANASTEFSADAESRRGTARVGDFKS
jgi:hypothetical protein